MLTEKQGLTLLLSPRYLASIWFLCGLFLGELPAQAAGPRIHDEWAPIDSIVISTMFNQRTSRHEWNPMTFYTAAVASRHGIRVIVCTREASFHAPYRAALMKMKFNEDGKPVIRKESDIRFIENLLPSDWARDHAPIVVFTQPDVGELRGFNTFQTISDSEKSVVRMGVELGIATHGRLPAANYSGHVVPLNFEGGNWMTANEGEP